MRLILMNTFPTQKKNGNTLSLELWFDKDKRIQRIRQGIFWSRSYGLETVRKIVGVDASCDYPESVFYDFWFHDFKELENGIFIPLRVTVDAIKPDTKNDPRYKELWEHCKRKRNLEFLIKSATFNKITLKNDREIIIDETSLKVNEPILEETFIAPPVTEILDNISSLRQPLWLVKLKPFIFVAICIAITFLIMFITQRYLG